MNFKRSHSFPLRQERKFESSQAKCPAMNLTPSTKSTTREKGKWDERETSTAISHSQEPAEWTKSLAKSIVEQSSDRESFNQSSTTKKQWQRQKRFLDQAVVNSLLQVFVSFLFASCVLEAVASTGLSVSVLWSSCALFCCFCRFSLPPQRVRTSLFCSALVLAS